MSVQLLGVAALALLGMGAAEARLHRIRLASIRTRIHVAGTRGKSSVTRLVAGGLRRSGIVTVAKTTGSLPCIVHPDGRDAPLFRAGAPNVLEQRRVAAMASALGAEALVVECMALQPELHWLSEAKLVRATHAVITNVRADHLEVMGPTEADVARCLAGMIPVKGVLVTAEDVHVELLAAACADRGTRMLRVTDEDRAAVSDELLAKFGHIEHRDNVAVTLKLLTELGVEPTTALEGMWDAAPDPGALTEHELSFFGRKIVFVNAFAANDPDSTARVFRLARERHPELQRVVALFNLREDRPDRTGQLARAHEFWRTADHVLAVGATAFHFAREAERHGAPADTIGVIDHGGVEAIFESVLERCGPSTLVVGMGNIGGAGFELVRMFKNRRSLGPVGSTSAEGPT